VKSLLKRFGSKVMDQEVDYHLSFSPSKEKGGRGNLGLKREEDCKLRAGGGIAEEPKVRKIRSPGTSQQPSNKHKGGEKILLLAWEEGREKSSEQAELRTPRNLANEKIVSRFQKER